MAKVTGIGGVFFKSDRDQTRQWLKEKLGLETEEWGRSFTWRERENPEKKGYTVLGLRSKDTDYFAPATVDFMINFRVDDLDAMLAQLREQGVEITKVFDPEPNGKFAHVMAPGGIKIELWEPVSPDPYDP